MVELSRSNLELQEQNMDLQRLVQQLFCSDICPSGINPIVCGYMQPYAYQSFVLAH
jgi:hypothetical protein